MTSAQVVETSVIYNSSFQKYSLLTIMQYELEMGCAKQMGREFWTEEKQAKRSENASVVFRLHEIVEIVHF